MSTALVPFSDVQAMAASVHKSGLFPGCKTLDATVTIMLVAQAEGRHPIEAMRRYDVIDGKPSKKTDAMLADFQEAGGKVRWIEVTDKRCSAEFTSSGSTGGTTVTWSMEDASRAGLATKAMWGKYPRQMLRARVVSEGLRLVCPGVVVGLYTPEEVVDFEPSPVKPANANAEPAPAPAVVDVECEPVPAAPPRTVPQGAPAQGDLYTPPPAQARTVRQALADLYPGDSELAREKRASYVAWVTGREVATPKDLTDAEKAAIVSRADDRQLPPDGWEAAGQ